MSARTNTAFINMTPEMKGWCDQVAESQKRINKDLKIEYRPVYKKENGNWHVALDYDNIVDVCIFFFVVGGYSESQKQEESD